MKEITACTLDCPDACSLIITRDAEGGLKVRGNPDHPVTRGFTCKKAKTYLDRLKSPHRVTTPLLRKGESWERLSWDDALDLCARKIQEARLVPATMLHIHGEGAKGVLKQASRLFFAKLGASRIHGSLCDAAGYVACALDFGSRENNDITDLLNTTRIVNWGKDLSRSSIHTAALVRLARGKGARVLTISPGGDGNDDFTDERVRVRPGVDRFLAAAVARRLIEEGRVPPNVGEISRGWERYREILFERPMEDLLGVCGVSLEDLERVASFYRGEAPTASIIGAGVQRHAFGAGNVRFINALALVSGSVGRSGGGTYFHLHSLRNLNLDWTFDPDNKPRRGINIARIGEELLAADPPVRFLWVNGSNVVNQAPDSLRTARAFESIPFKVVVDAFMTDTARRADLFLPCTLMHEQEDVEASYLHNYIHYVKPVLDAPGEARSDYHILRDLGARLEPPVALPDPDEIFRAALDSPKVGFSLEDLRERRFVRAKGPAVVYEGLRFDHPDGKYRFPADLHDEPPGEPGYPLRLLTLVRRDFIHSQMLPDQQSMPPTAWIAPDSEEAGRFASGERVALVSSVGRLEVVLEFMPGLHPEVVVYRRGDWMGLGGGANRIIAGGLTDAGKGAPFYKQHVKIERV